MHDNDFKIGFNSKATLVSVISPAIEGHNNENESKRSLTELHELLRTLGIKSQSEFIQKRTHIEAGTVLGTGKLLEIAEVARNEDSDILVFDFELSASQVRNIRELTGMTAFDRCHIILEIFASHAKTRDAKIQIEISRLQYLLPRLTGLWTHFSRQRGGVGVQGGEGEKQIELDRRMIQEKIEFLKKELDSVMKSRHEQKKRRKDRAVIAALVGYTNAGKSSLMNRLCKVSVLEENKLFATLDPTHRTLNPDTHPPMILIDTVGFLSNLPNTLIEGFKTTLESAMDADLLIVVCDISDPNYKKHLEVTHKVLGELGIDEKDQMIVFNKKDLLQDPFVAKLAQRTHPGSFVISSFDENDVINLRRHIAQYFLKKQTSYDLFVPYSEGRVHSTILKNSNVINSSHHETGTFYRIKTPEAIFNQLGIHQFILSPQHPRFKDWEELLAMNKSSIS